MKVTFDNDGYVEMLIMKGDLPNSVELPDDDTIDMKYLACYQLGYDGTQLVLDAKKVQRIESNLRAETLVYDLRKQLSDTDYKVLRHIRELALGIPTTMAQEEYLLLEAQRESLVRQIREIEDGTKLETDPNVILQEGFTTRQTKAEKEEVIEETINKTVPDLAIDVEKLKEESKTEIVENTNTTEENEIEESSNTSDVVEPTEIKE